MSYDVAIWKSARPLDGKSAVKVYKSLEKDGAAETLEKAPALKKFHAALMKRFPPLSEDNEEECPWASGVELGDRYVVAPMSFSWVDDALFEIRALAAKHGLEVFDPQKKKVLEAPDPEAKPDPKKRLKADPAIQQLCRGLAAPMKKLGFDTTKREGVTGSVFVRKQKKHAEEIAFINIGGRDVITHLAVRYPAVSAIIDPILQAHFRKPRGGARAFGRGAAVAAGSVYIALDLPEKQPRPVDHDICHQECVERSIRAIPAAVKRTTLPLFEKLATLADIDAFYHQGFDRHVRGHEWEELPVSALVVAKLTKRKDLKAWIAHYEKGRAQSAELKAAWPDLMRAIR